MFLKKGTYFWFLQKGRAHFWLLNKGELMLCTLKNVNMKATKFCDKSIFLILNFVKNLFSSYWILWRVGFSHIKFCEESVFFNVEFCEMSENILNFPPRQTLILIMVQIFGSVLNIQSNLLTKYSVLSKYQYSVQLY